MSKRNVVLELTLINTNPNVYTLALTSKSNVNVTSLPIEQNILFKFLFNREENYHKKENN